MNCLRLKRDLRSASFVDARRWNLFTSTRGVALITARKYRPTTSGNITNYKNNTVGPKLSAKDIVPHGPSSTAGRPSNHSPAFPHIVASLVVLGGHGAAINAHVRVGPTTASPMPGTEIGPPCPVNKLEEDLAKAHVNLSTLAGGTLSTPVTSRSMPS